jgi:hypothetical protein
LVFESVTLFFFVLSFKARVFSVNKKNRERESFFDATFSEREEIHHANHVDEDDGGGTRDEE